VSVYKQTLAVFVCKAFEVLGSGHPSCSFPLVVSSLKSPWSTAHEEQQFRGVYVH